MRDPSIKSYAPPFELGKPITNRAICKVLKSNNAKFKEGDVIVCADSCGTEEYSALPQDVTERAFKLENPYNLDPKIFIGALGMPGLTAWSSFYEIGEPKKGDTIFISAASGAVGQLVGQLAKHEGLTAIGSVGDDKKLEFIEKELGFDGGFNYKKEKPRDALKRLAPEGIDIYYENVGGEQLEAAIDALKPFGRISEFSKYAVLPALISKVGLGGVRAYALWDSRVRHDQPVQRRAVAGLRHPQHDAVRGQALEDAGFHRRRREHGAQVREGTPGEATEVDCGWQLQGQDERDRGH